MKHLRLFETNDEQMSDVLLNPSAPYPIVSYSKDNIKVGFCGNPVVNAEVMIPQIDEDDMPFFHICFCKPNLMQFLSIFYTYSNCHKTMFKNFDANITLI